MFAIRFDQTPHAINDMLGLDPSLVGDDGRDLAGDRWPGSSSVSTIEHFGVGEHLEPSLLDGLLAEQGAGLERVDHD